MKPPSYHFITHWKIRGPIGVVYGILKDGPRYADWWRPAYVRSEAAGPNKVRSLVRAKLPYTLEFITEGVKEDPPHSFTLRSTGELAGTGVWSLCQEGTWTSVEFVWDVSTEKKWIRRLTPLLRPFFSWNHNWVMKQGGTRLQEEVNRHVLRHR